MLYWCITDSRSVRTVSSKRNTTRFSELQEVKRAVDLIDGPNGEMVEIRITLVAPERQICRAHCHRMCGAFGVLGHVFLTVSDDRQCQARCNADAKKRKYLPHAAV